MEKMAKATLVGRPSVVDTRWATRVGRHAGQVVSPIQAAKTETESVNFVRRFFRRIRGKKTVDEPAVQVAEKAMGKPVVTVADKVSNYIGFLPEGDEITIDDVMMAQKAWGDAVVAIGKAGDGAKAMAEEVARTAYAFDLGPIMFKPTLASEIPFRQDLEGTLSYFVAGNSRFPEDKGFALKPWTNVKFVNDTVKIMGNMAIAMGHYYFTDKDGNDTKAEYTKGYVKTPDGRVLLFLQDSSLPYSPS